MSHIDIVKTIFWMCAGFVAVGGAFVIIKKVTIFFLKTLVPTKQDIKDMEEEIDDKLTLKTDEKDYILHKSNCGISFDDLKQGQVNINKNQELMHQDIQAIRTLMDRLVDNFITRNLK